MLHSLLDNCFVYGNRRDNLNPCNFTNGIISRIHIDIINDSFIHVYALYLCLLVNSNAIVSVAVIALHSVCRVQDAKTVTGCNIRILLLCLFV